MRTTRIFAFTLFLTCVFFVLPTFSDDYGGDYDTGGDYLIEYPDGKYGMDLGGGYFTMPDGTMEPPSGYRQYYQDTPYGPMTDTGLTIFPSFKLPEGRAREEKQRIQKEREKERVKEYMFHEATTGTAGSSVWGISD